MSGDGHSNNGDSSPGDTNVSGDPCVSPQEPGASAGGNRTRLVALVLLVAVAGLAAWLFRDELSLESLAARETQFRDVRARHPWLIYGVAFATYVAVTGMSLPGAAGMTLVYGWLFGFWRAVILVSFASTTGATVAFLLSRYLLRDAIQGRFGDRLTGFNRALEREGAFYLFTLRLIPLVPFFVINVVMGLTPLATATFWWVSQLGMLPGTAVYVWAGASVPTLAELAEKGAGGILSLELLAAFAALGLFPLVAKKVMAALRPAASTETEAAAN